MYHAHAHAQEAVPNGMFGTIFVGEMPVPAGRTVSGIKVPADVKISQHIPMVLNDAGVIGLSLDGKSFPATAPIGGPKASCPTPSPRRERWSSPKKLAS